MKKHLFLLILLFFSILPAKSEIFVQVSGNSMHPTLKDGEILGCTKAKKFVVGDIIVFEKNGETIVHRIISKIFGKYITKGDNNLIPDLFFVDEKEIICKVEK